MEHQNSGPETRRHRGNETGAPGGLQDMAECGRMWYLGGWTLVVGTEECCDAETLQEQTLNSAPRHLHRTQGSEHT